MAEHAVEQTTHEGFPAIALSSPGGLSATYAPGVGMVGCSLRHEGEELLAQRGGLSAYAATGSTFGIPLLHPWANRLAAFEYEAAGRRVEIPRDAAGLRLDPNGLPIHGLLAASPHWRVTDMEADPDSARLSAAFDFHSELLEAFPFPHRLTMDVRLSGAGLTVATTLTPTDDVPVPVSFGYHPYLRLPGVARADWSIELPVGRHLVLDERSIPTGESEPADEPPGPLGDRDYDDGYADLFDPPVFALEGGGRRIEVEFGRGYRFAQVYAPRGQDLICFEPMTAPTNALVSGRQLPLAEPGQPFSAAFELRIARS